MFVRLTYYFPTQGEPITININHIHTVWPHANGKGCSLALGPDSKNRIQVNESFDEVQKLIDRQIGR
jgi:hypothetical protein